MKKTTISLMFVAAFSMVALQSCTGKAQANNQMQQTEY